MTSVTILTKGMQAVTKKYKGVEISKVAMLETHSKAGNIVYGTVLVEFKSINYVSYDHKYYEVEVTVYNDRVEFSITKEC